MIVRGPRKERSFTILGNEIIRDGQLSFRARGVLSFLLSQPEGFAVRSEDLARAGTEGRDAIRTALREIETAGYLHREKVQHANGQWTTIAVIYEERKEAPKTPTTAPPCQPGWVYYVRLGDGTVKIGWTGGTGPTQRAAMHGGEFVAAEEGDRSLEQQRHSQFAAALVAGQEEVFHETTALTKLIADLRRRARAPRPGPWRPLPGVFDAEDGNPGAGDLTADDWKSDAGSADVGSAVSLRSTGLEELEPEGLKQTPLTPLSGGDDDLVEDPIGPSKASKKPSKASNRKRAPTAKDVRDDEFESFWSTYPRHTSKPEARRALAKALTRASLNTILVGACRYRDDPNRVDEFTKHPTTWLNQDCWDDDPLPPRSDNGVKHANPKAGTFVGGTRRITEEELEEAGL